MTKATQKRDRGSNPDSRHKILDGKRVAAELRQQIIQPIKDLTYAGFGPNLVSISVGESNVSRVYVRNQKRAAEALGIGFEERILDASIGVAEVLAVIQSLNVNPAITGIIVQRPVPAHIPLKTVQSAVHPLKDVEGMHPASIGNIVYNDLVMGPCTAVAAVELLKRTKLHLQGLEVVVIGHSEIVGKPIAFLLMSEGATVTVCHHMTRNLAVHSRQADAVFVAVGQPGLVTGDMIKPGAAVIDIGINQVKGADGHMALVGDADFESCAQVAGWITPVPGGVGPVTVAVFMRNAVTAATLLKQRYAESLTSGS